MAFRDRKQQQEQPQKHRHRAAPPPSDDDEQDPDRELDSYLAALAPEADLGGSELTGRFGSAEVFQLRLPALRIEQLRRFAAERGVTPGSLALDWVIERLDAEDPLTGPVSIVPPAEAAGAPPTVPGRARPPLSVVPPPVAAPVAPPVTPGPPPPVADPGRHRR